jgi:hypothetical protein
MCLNRRKKMKLRRFGAMALAAGMLAGCMSQTSTGGGSSMATGSAGAAGSQNESSKLVKCQRPLGTMALVEQQNPALTQAGLTSPIPVLRLLVAQSNCFQVVDRGQGLTAMQQERQLMQQGALAGGSNVGKGQMVAADYLLTPNIVFKDENSGGGSGLLGAFIPGIGGAIASNVNIQNSEAQTVLFLTNTRTGLQEAVAEGSGSTTDIGLGLFGGGSTGLGGLGAYGSTDIGKTVVAALVDSYNNLVGQVKAMKAQ